MPRNTRVGCSGWQYTHWRGDFYPAELPRSRWFAHYTLTFDTVEINNSFSISLFARLNPPRVGGGPFIYVQFHFETKKYGRRLHVFACFNNDTRGQAPRDAMRLRKKIAGTIARRANARAPRTYTSDR
jgi:uncharacterized protein YecE (DUF72 family)